MEYFDKYMALGEIEDALTDIYTPYGRGVAVGICSAFYMCGLLSHEEWQSFMAQIPFESCHDRIHAPENRLQNFSSGH